MRFPKIYVQVVSSGMSIDPYLVIKLNYIQMNPAMKRIADTLLSSEADVSRFTIKQLSESSGVSNATVTRFIKMLGFDNFKAFSHTLQEYVKNKATDADRTPSTNYAVMYAGGFPHERTAESICHYVIGSEMEMLNDTLSLMSFPDMERIADLIIGARHVVFLGEGRSFLATQSACWRFTSIGVLCHCYGDSHGMLTSICMARKDDLVIGISNLGHSALVLEGLERAKRAGIHTVAITSVKGSPVDTAADDTLLTGFNYGNFANPSVATCYEPGSENLPQYSMIDCLYLICVMRQKQECLDRYYKAARLIDATRR